MARRYKRDPLGRFARGGGGGPGRGNKGSSPRGNYTSGNTSPKAKAKADKRAAKKAKGNARRVKAQQRNKYGLTRADKVRLSIAGGIIAANVVAGAYGKANGTTRREHEDRILQAKRVGMKVRKAKAAGRRAYNRARGPIVIPAVSARGVSLR